MVSALWAGSVESGLAPPAVVDDQRSVICASDGPGVAVGLLGVGVPPLSWPVAVALVVVVRVEVGVPPVAPVLAAPQANPGRAFTDPWICPQRATQDLSPLMSGNAACSLHR